MSPGGFAVATFSESTLISRSRSRLANFSLILSRPTAVTSMAPLDEPSRTFS